MHYDPLKGVLRTRFLHHCVCLHKQLSNRTSVSDNFRLEVDLANRMTDSHNGLTAAPTAAWVNDLYLEYRKRKGKCDRKKKKGATADRRSEFVLLQDLGLSPTGTSKAAGNTTDLGRVD
jgi:hypothetical protein